jgi:alpha 1,2-mannosyltransferase
MQLAFISVTLSSKQRPYKFTASVSSFIYTPKLSPNHLPAINPDPAGAQPILPSVPTTSTARQNENATFFMLTTNSEADIKSAMQSLREVEDRFNRWYHYPWVFLNDEPFSGQFKTYVPTRPRLHHVLTLLPTKRVLIIESGAVYFGQIPDDYWNRPPWINDTKMEEQMKKMDDIPRAGSISCMVHLLLAHV